MHDHREHNSLTVLQVCLIISFTTFVLVAFMTIWSGIANDCWSFRRNKSKKGEQRQLIVAKVPSTIKLVVMPGSSIQFAQQLDLSKVKDWSQRSDAMPVQDSNRGVATLYQTESLRFSSNSLPAADGGSLVDDSSVHNRQDSKDSTQLVPSTIELSAMV